MKAIADDQGIEARWRQNRGRRIPWRDLVHVAFVNIDAADRFFWTDPGYWELQAVDGTRLSIYSREARSIGLVDRMAQLPEFSLEAAQRAMAGRGYVHVWSRGAVSCPLCGSAMAAQAQSGPRRWDGLLRCTKCDHRRPLGREQIIGG